MAIDSLDKWAAARHSSESEALLEDVQLTLENDARWYRWCNNPGRGSLLDVDAVHWSNALRYYYHQATYLDAKHRIFLRVYFEWRYRTDQKQPPPKFNPNKDPRIDYRKNLFNPPEIPDKAELSAVIVPPTPTEKPMASNKLTFKPVYILNGVDLQQQSKDAVYEQIAAEEKRIEKLKEIKHQPKSLVAEIEQSEATLQTLVDHLDAA